MLKAHDTGLEYFHRKKQTAHDRTNVGQKCIKMIEFQIVSYSTDNLFEFSPQLSTKKLTSTYRWQYGSTIDI